VGLGHPLIHADRRITNDFTLEGRGTIALVTGSNMAGKSTFLRTVGINTVLALAGAPVCADDLEVSCLQVFTSMRTQDDLNENTSSFMAELRRINQLVNLLRSEETPVLFLLDEILKGTNSVDRHAGAKALARQLSRARAYGLLSTHDLELVSLSREMNLANYSFNSRIEDDKIWFDYHLTEGPCQTANATALMRQLGVGL
jgi:DNA mismatch repair ATPase MutS